MNKKLHNFAIMLAIISGISFLYTIIQQYIFNLIGSNSLPLLYLVNLFGSLGKVGIPLSFIENGSFEIYDSKLLKTVLANSLTIIISLATLVGALQFIASKGRHGKKRIKFALVLIAINCFTSFFFILIRLYIIATTKIGTITLMDNIFVFVFFAASILMLVYAIYGGRLLHHFEKQYFNSSSFQGSSIFNEAQTDAPQYEITSTGFRFLNVLIDRVLLFIILINNAFYLLQINKVQMARAYARFDNDYGIAIFYVLFFVFFIFYYTFFEKVFGYTAGKALTNTKVINEAGENISIGQAFGRTFSRFVPFEWISAFMGSMWHDNWTNTFVVDNHNVQTNAEVTDVGVLY